MYKGIGGVAIAIRPAYTKRCEAKKTPATRGAARLAWLLLYHIYIDVSIVISGLYIGLYRDNGKDMETTVL